MVPRLRVFLGLASPCVAGRRLWLASMRCRAQTLALTFESGGKPMLEFCFVGHRTLVFHRDSSLGTDRMRSVGDAMAAVNVLGENFIFTKSYLPTI